MCGCRADRFCPRSDVFSRVGCPCSSRPCVVVLIQTLLDPGRVGASKTSPADPRKRRLSESLDQSLPYLSALKPTPGRMFCISLQTSISCLAVPGVCTQVLGDRVSGDCVGLFNGDLLLIHCNQSHAYGTSRFASSSPRSVLLSMSVLSLSPNFFLQCCWVCSSVLRSVRPLSWLISRSLTERDPEEHKRRREVVLALQLILTQSSALLDTCVYAYICNVAPYRSILSWIGGHT